MCKENVSIQENSSPAHHGTCVELCFLDEIMSQEIRGLRHNDSQDHYHRANA